MEHYLTLTDEQRLIIDRAVELLTPFAQNEEDNISQSTVYFKMGRDEASSEYNTCDNDKCIKESKREIRKSYGKGTHVEECWSRNDGDHEHIERCFICGRPLSNSLTWIKSELEHHEEYSKELSDFINHSAAFDVKVLLESMPSCDERITGYDIHQNSIGNPIPLQEQQKRQEVFINRVIDYAKLVISILETNNT